MSARRWSIHPAVVIAHRAGKFSLGRLSGTAPTLAMIPPDLVLLARFMRPASVEQAVGSVLKGPDARFLPNTPPAELVQRRLIEFQRHGVLIAAEGSETTATTAGAPVPGFGAGSRDARPAPSARIRLPRNFALRPTSAGFEAHSARSGNAYCLNLELALMLLAFADGRDLAQAADAFNAPLAAERLAQVAAWFLAEGLLMPADGAQSAAAAHNPKQLPLRTASAPGWRDQEPDGRIPVYFFPHMENHFPLALGMIYGALASCNNGALLDRFELVPITYLPPEAFLQGPYRKFGRGVWLFSNYMWSIDLNLGMSAAVKRHDGGNLTIHGGPSTPNYEQACENFMARNRSVDIAVHGEGEVACCEILEAVERAADGRLKAGPRLAEIEGITYRVPGGGRRDLIRTPPRLRMREPDVIPSPYTGGVFDPYEGRVEAAIVETNRGCPFKCTFCDWGSATNQKVTKFELRRVHDELEWVGRNRIGVLWIADANFGMLKRDLEIARWIVDIKQRHGYPREVVVNYTKNANERLAEIIKVFTDGGIISQGIISIQTTDEKTLEIIDRKNIKTEKYDELIDIFSGLGLPLSTDLMIGLPGITPAAFDRDLQRYIDVDVSVKAYPTQLLPNSPMAHPAYREKYRIEVDEDDFLISCSSYSAAELEEMKLTYHVYTVTDGYGTLRHVMRYLQWRHGIPAMQLIHDLIDLMRTTPDRYPAVTWVIRYFATEKCMPGGWRRFYDEIGAWVERQYGIRRDAAFDTVLEVSEALMPDESRAYPMTVSLAYDYLAWFADHNRTCAGGRARSLAAYPPGSITVSDPNRMASIDFEYQQYDTHQFFWELHSPVSRVKSVAEVIPGTGGELREVQSA